MKKIYSNRNLSDLEAERVKKYIYEHVTVELEGIFSDGLNNMAAIRSYIRRYGEQGWRYAGWIPVEAIQYRNFEAQIRTVNLIFEKEIDE